jgi:hypothetical protein
MFAIYIYSSQTGLFVKTHYHVRVFKKITVTCKDVRALVTTLANLLMFDRQLL